MQQPPIDTNHATHPGPDPDQEVEVLITRLVDGEADDADRQRFEHLAAAEPTRWRQLALQQQDMRWLRDAVDEEIDTAARTALPAAASGGGSVWARLVPARVTWTLALSGWAALLLVALWWGVTTSTVPTAVPEVKPVVVEPRLTPEEHYERYLRAGYVVGEMQPMVTAVEAMPDGRVAVRFVRRVEELAFLDPSDLPVDEDGELTRDLRFLRNRERAFAPSN